MKKLFPEMSERLGTGYMICSFAYWLLCFLLFPFFIPIVAHGLWDDLTALSWIEIVYCGINGGVLIAVMKEHLSDCTLQIQLTPKGLQEILSVCVPAVGMMAVYVLLAAPGISMVFGIPLEYMANAFPMTESAVVLIPSLAVNANPLFATAVFTLLSPFAICGLFYASAFGPVCCRNRWLGYLTVALVLVLPAAFTCFWRGQPELWTGWYLFQLPVHWLACWTYQKTDNVWAPIISLAMINLISSLLSI